MEKIKLDRINELAHKSKAEGLTPEEKAEQAVLRAEFLAEIRADVKASLESIEFVEEVVAERYNDLKFCLIRRLFMEKLGVNELRDMFRDFFVSKGHYAGGSASLIPRNDKSLLIINSGMAPLKP